VADSASINNDSLRLRSAEVPVSGDQTLSARQVWLKTGSD